ncbi:MAG TPA: MerR family DNA-binding protein [Acidimicrobiales bacterium]|nr:MerR family DNA-binding protein [Acidimicrobiales bacterium]
MASRSGVNVQTLRYYERRGILPEPERSGSRYRSYDDQAVRTVRFVKGAQQLGFSLEEIDSLLELAVGGPRNCDAAKELATEKIGQLEGKIARLSAMRDSLRQLVATCDRSPDKRDCPLLERVGATAVVEEAEGPYPSPTVLIEGVEIAGYPLGPGPACRIDLPTRDEIAAAILAACTRATIPCA